MTTKNKLLLLALLALCLLLVCPAEAEEAKENAIKAATEAIENQTGILDEWNEKSQATWEEMQDI